MIIIENRLLALSGNYRNHISRDNTKMNIMHYRVPAAM